MLRALVVVLGFAMLGVTAPAPEPLPTLGAHTPCMGLVADAFAASDDSTIAYIEAGIAQADGLKKQVRTLIKDADAAFDRETQIRIRLEQRCGLRPPPDWAKPTINV